MSFTASALLVSWVAIALLGFALAGVLARVHRLERALGGEEAVPVSIGRRLALPGLDAGPALALFVDPGCASCDRAAATMAGDHRARVVRRDDDPEAFAVLDVRATPFAVVADADLRIVTALPVGSPTRLAEAIATLDDLEAGATA